MLYKILSVLLISHFGVLLFLCYLLSSLQTATCRKLVDGGRFGGWALWSLSHPSKGKHGMDFPDLDRFMFGTQEEEEDKVIFMRRIYSCYPSKLPAIGSPVHYKGPDLPVAVCLSREGLLVHRRQKNNAMLLSIRWC